MPTPQEIREQSFEKSVFGGYDMTSVDNYLSAIADELQAAQKETATLKAKLKILATKIEEYRGSEDALNKVLLTAQKTASEITASAETKSRELLEQAKEEAVKMLATAKEERDRSIEEANRQIAEQNELLLEAKLNTADFIEQARLVGLKHLEWLDNAVKSVSAQNIASGKAIPDGGATVVFAAVSADGDDDDEGEEDDDGKSVRVERSDLRFGDE